MHLPRAQSDTAPALPATPIALDPLDSFLLSLAVFFAEPSMAKHPPRLSRWPFALLALSAALAAAPIAYSQDIPSFPTELASTEARLQNVESQLQKLLDADTQRQSDAAQMPTLETHGLLHIDSVFIGQNSANRATVGDADDVIDFRRARITFSGEAFDVVEYAAGFDFALPGRPSFLDNWIAIRDLPLLGNIRGGHFFEPFSLERCTVVRYTTFMERSLADILAPARNIGLMAHDTIGDEQLGTWAAGIFASNSNDFGDEFVDAGGTAATTRATWLPYYDQDTGGRSFVHLGAAYTYRLPSDNELRIQSFPEARAGAPNLTSGIPPFVDTGTIDATSDQRLGWEFALVHGPLYFQSEYMCLWADQIGGQPLFFQGAYAYVTYFLTGENRTYDKERGTIDRVYPYENFFRVRTDDGVQTGRGAWEIAARWSYIDLNSQNIQGGQLNNITLALNWHLNPYTRVHWEYIYAMLDRDPIGDSFAQIAGMRFDIDF
jgi:phosphate-selective porin OprO/OprP